MKEFDAPRTQEIDEATPVVEVLFFSGSIGESAIIDSPDKGIPVILSEQILPQCAERSVRPPCAIEFRQANAVETPYNNLPEAKEGNEPEEITELEKQREEILRKLLPIDYDYAKREGLVDMFYSSERGDGLMHTLGGVQRGRHAAGYHHEPSAEFIWPTSHDDGLSRPVTYVDRTHITQLSIEEQERCKEYPFEPYAARAVVNGRLKQQPKVDKGVQEPNNTTMYPKEYDALAVMQAIRIARDTRDKSKDCLVGQSGRQVIRATGSAPLIDGKTTMEITMILRLDTEQVITAYPRIDEHGLMRLAPEEVAGHLLQGYTKRVNHPEE